MPITEEFTAELEAAAEKAVSEDIYSEDSQDKKQEEIHEENQEENEEQEAEGEGQQEIIHDDLAEQKQEEISKEEIKQPAPSLPTLTRAIRLGFTAEEAYAFPNEQSLLSACAVAERMHDQASRQQQGEQAEEEDDPFSIFDNLNTDEFEPEVAQLFGTLVDQIRTQRQEIHELRLNQEYTTQVGQEATAREVEGWFDKQIEELGPDFQETLGSSGYRSLSQGSPQLEKRDAIAEQMAVILAGYQAIGRQPPPREEVFNQVAAVVLADEFTAIKQRQVQKDLLRMSKQHINRADTQENKSTTESPTEEAARLLDEKYFHKK